MTAADMIGVGPAVTVTFRILCTVLGEDWSIIQVVRCPDQSCGDRGLGRQQSAQLCGANQLVGLERRCFPRLRMAILTENQRVCVQDRRCHGANAKWWITWRTAVVGGVLGYLPSFSNSRSNLLDRRRALQRTICR